MPARKGTADFDIGRFGQSRPRSDRAHPILGGRRSGSRAPAASGSRRTKQAPRPGSLRTSSVPPKVAAIRCATARPEADARHARRDAPARRERTARRRAASSSAASPQPRSSHAQERPTPSSRQARTTIGVPGALYLHAFSSRLSTSWASSGGWTRTTSEPVVGDLAPRSAARGWTPIGRGGRAPSRARSTASGSGRPPSGWASRSSDSTICRRRMPSSLDPLQDPPVLLRRAVAAERDLDLAEQGRQRACGAGARRRRRTAAAGRAPRGAGGTLRAAGRAGR